MAEVENGEIDYKMIVNPGETDWEKIFREKSTIQVEEVAVPDSRMASSIIGNRDFHYKRVEGATDLVPTGYPAQKKIVFRAEWDFKRGAKATQILESVPESPVKDFIPPKSH